MHILICGGAGYIGSHMAKMLYEHDYEVTVFDNLSTGHRHALQWGRFIQGDLEHSLLNQIITLCKRWDTPGVISGKSLGLEHFVSRHSHQFRGRHAAEPCGAGPANLRHPAGQSGTAGD